MRTAGKKLLSLALAVLLAVGTLPPPVYAQAPKIGGEIIAFAELPEGTARQEVPLGATIDDLKLPESLTATVQKITVEDTKDSGQTVKDSGKPKFTEASISVPVLEWVCEEFDAEALGTYTFTPVLDGAYSLAQGVELPTVTVEIKDLPIPTTLGANFIEAKNINVDLSHLMPDNNGWTSNGQKVYIGQYGGTPTAYRVLEINMTNKTMLLDSDKSLMNRDFGEYGQIWPNSDIRTWLIDNFYSDGAVFHDIERAAIVKTDSDNDGPYRIESNNYTQTYSFTDYGAEDHIFLLTVRQVDELYSDAAARIKNSSWRTRTSDGVGTCCVMPTGEYVGWVSNYPIGIAPAFNLNMKSVILTSAAGANKATSLIETMDGSGINEWKLTLKDNAQSFILGVATRSGDTITVPYTYSYSGSGTDATQISAMITQGDRMESGSTVKYYGKVSTGNITQGNGSVTFNLPVNYDPSTDEIYIFSEQVNGNSLSDYASEPQRIIANAETPNITTQPQSATYNQGATATTLSVAASVNDGGTLTYRWFSNTTNSTTGGTAITGETVASYTPATDTVGAQYYFCVVTNTNMGVIGNQTAIATSNTAKITVVPIVDAQTPNITTQPQSATYKQGETATALSVAASVNDGGSLTYQWFSNTTNSTEGGTAIDGATEESYTPDTNTVGDLYYYCVVTNTNMGANGTPTAVATSTTAKVTVTPNGGSSSSSDDDNDTPVNSKGSLSVYGVNVPYTLHSSSGVMTLELTTPLLDQMLAAANGNKTIGIPAGNRAGLKELVVNFPPAWFAQHTDVTIPVQSGIGGITLSNNLAKQFPNQGTTATVSLQAGSLIFSAQQNGTAVTWNDSSAPVYVNLPYSLPANGDASTVLLYNKATGAAAAHSYYSGGRVYAAVSSPGTYEAKIGSISFSDTQSHAAKDDIAFAVSHGLLSGTSSTAFSPDTAITRADFVTALGKLAGVDSGKYQQSRFTDVANDSPAMPYIEWAAANNLLPGAGNQSFAPNQAITREQMALLLVNYAKLSHQGLPKVRVAVPFADSSMLSVEAQQAANALQQADILTAKNGNRFDPQGNVTRAEASTILHRFAKVLIDGEKGWLQTSAGQWRYIDSDYQPRKGWLTTVAGNSYYFDSNGLMVSGTWLQIGGKWYYFNTDGTLAKNTQIDGYRIDASGIRID